jgi:hypothetical protein
MSKNLFKEDDGYLDIVLKFGSILAILFAAHQYFYKLYPVWSKENELKNTLQNLKVAEIKNETLDTETLYLKNLERELKNSIEVLSIEKNKLKQSYAFTIDKLKNEKTQALQLMQSEMHSTQKNLFKASSEVQKLRVEVLVTHLNFHTDKIFKIKLDSIISSVFSGSEKPDFKDSTLAYVDSSRVDVKSDIEGLALDIIINYVYQLKNYSDSSFNTITFLPESIKLIPSSYQLNVLKSLEYNEDAL